MHPNRTKNHPGNPPPPRTRVAPHAACARGGGQAAAYFAALGTSWRLTAAQCARLVPAIKAALDAGWTPQALAAFTGASTDGVRSPYAVLAARLSPAELPAPQARVGRPPWCGECDEATRMLGFYGDAPRPCPHCKPQLTARRRIPAEVDPEMSAAGDGRYGLALGLAAVADAWTRCHVSAVITALRAGPIRYGMFLGWALRAGLLRVSRGE